ncbi:tellurite resistance/C4-dicarboxylate transporter family protein [Nocardioides insulae]|uniref:tellurite resistance/C4-dicarboxylate transporter family protein n=1 Tax=Nocardioides insulae TaxID=394734 RepID=UPI00042287AB|nr:tellurite resistance/C4-dicarboxylate transporter family protein [Nocardioides insulae]
MGEGILDRFRRAAQGLTPGYFALVMASGILSVGFELQGYAVLSGVLLAICAAAYLLLGGLTLYRLVAYPSAMGADFHDPRRAFGFFTLIAGTNVLGTRLAAAGLPELTAALLVLSGAGWLVLGYVIPWTAVLGRQERPVVATANGTWFIWVVASQSVAISAASIEPVFTGARQWLALLAVTSWSIGVFLYAAAGILVALRLMLYDFGPEELDPPYWVAMGAAAITVLSAARIVEMADAPMVNVTRDLIAGLGVVFWAFATWLIPVLVAAGVWRHWARRVPLRYEATLWSIIFPLGMYGVAGLYLGEADQLPIVGRIGQTELWIALAAGVTVFVAMVRHQVRTVLLPRNA